MKLILALLALLSAYAQAATVTIDGRVIDATRVDIVTNQVPEPEPTPGPEPEPEPTPGPTPQGVSIQPAINWASPGGRRTLSIQKGETLAFPFRATSNPGYAGSAVISEVAGYELVIRRVWISRAPGGTPVSPEYRCSAEGNSARDVKWTQQANRFRCSLAPGSSYYLNIRNTAGCSGACGAYLSIITGGDP